MKPLWEPPEELRERSHMARLMADRGAADYASLWQWSVDDLAGFWAEVWRRFDVGGEPGEVLADAAMPGAVWFPEARLNYAERVFRGKPDDRVAILHASEHRELGEWTWGELRAQTAGIRAGLAARGVGPGDRVAAYLPERARDDRGVPGGRLARRDLVLGGARVRGAQRDRPLRADRAEGAARRRRLPLRRQGLRQGRRRRRDRRRDRRAGRAARLPRRERLGGGVPRRRPARVRAGAVRPPALGPLLVGHDRAAEGDRPGAGRDPARAPEDDVPAPRLPSRRPGVLVHHDGLDDVELPRLRAAHRRGDRALRRQPGHARPEPPVGSRRGRGR